MNVRKTQIRVDHGYFELYRGQRVLLFGFKHDGWVELHFTIDGEFDPRMRQGVKPARELALMLRAFREFALDLDVPILIEPRTNDRHGKRRFDLFRRQGFQAQGDTMVLFPGRLRCLLAR
jgi:hypothetical protein